MADATIPFEKGNIPWYDRSTIVPTCSYLLIVSQPNDEREQDRLDLLHHLQLLILDGKLYLAPISNPGRVLDVGTGTGIWAIDFADDHKSAEVIGIDLSPIQPLWVPPNVRFIVDDAESDWAYEANFDFVHIRSMAGSFRDMSKFFQQCFDHLNPQGWLEWKEFETVIRTDDDTFPPKSAYLELVDRMNEASEKFGRPMGLAPQIKTLMESAGFTNVSQKIFKVPLSPWPKDKKMKELGNWGQLATLESLQAYTLKLFTNVLGMEAVEAELLIKDAGTDVKDRSIHMYGSYYVVTGQKPKSA
ncbi:MAG: hypothetical protein M1816_007396 [Peltula sp. TS41687]|nr:MAG: hypothetical protein M1816_007396 [Peltula sp. TS41687]